MAEERTLRCRLFGCSMVGATDGVPDKPRRPVHFWLPSAEGQLGPQVDFRPVCERCGRKAGE